MNQPAENEHPPSGTSHRRPPVHITTDGDTQWLECFADDPSAEHGALICPVEPGGSWWELADKVDRHVTAHGCLSVARESSQVRKH